MVNLHLLLSSISMRSLSITFRPLCASLYHLAGACLAVLTWVCCSALCARECRAVQAPGQHATTSLGPLCAAALVHCAQACSKQRLVLAEVDSRHAAVRARHSKAVQAAGQLSYHSGANHAQHAQESWCRLSSCFTPCDCYLQHQAISSSAD